LHYLIALLLAPLLLTLLPLCAGANDQDSIGPSTWTVRTRAKGPPEHGTPRFVLRDKNQLTLQFDGGTLNFRRTLILNRKEQRKFFSFGIFGKEERQLEVWQLGFPERATGFAAPFGHVRQRGGGVAVSIWAAFLMQLNGYQNAAVQQFLLEKSFTFTRPGADTLNAILKTIRDDGVHFQTEANGSLARLPNPLPNNTAKSTDNFLHMDFPRVALPAGTIIDYEGVKEETLRVGDVVRSKIKFGIRVESTLENQARTSGSVDWGLSFFVKIVKAGINGRTTSLSPNIHAAIETYKSQADGALARDVFSEQLTATTLKLLSKDYLNANLGKK